MMPKKQAPSPSSTAVSSISSAAIPVSMYQYGAGQRDSARSAQPLSACAYRSRYAALCASGTTTRGASCIVGVCSTRVGMKGQNRARSLRVSQREEGPALREARRRGPQRAGQHSFDDLGRQRAAGVVPDHAPTADDLGELHAPIMPSPGASGPAPGMMAACRRTQHRSSRPASARRTARRAGTADAEPGRYRRRLGRTARRRTMTSASIASGRRTGVPAKPSHRVGARRSDRGRIPGGSTIVTMIRSLSCVPSRRAGARRRSAATGSTRR